MRPVPGLPRFSVGVAAATWGITLLVGYALTLVIFTVSGDAAKAVDTLPAWATVVSVTALWVPELVGLRAVSDRYGSGRFRSDYGASFRATDLLGIPIGVLSQLVLLELLYWPLRAWFPHTFGRSLVEKPARNLFDRAHGGWLVTLVVVVCVGAPIVEELMYRGLILRSIEGRIDDGLAILVTSAWFAFAHLQAVQLPGLFAFGIVLAICARRTGRLGMGMAAHAAFNATTVVMLLWHGSPLSFVR